MNQPSFWTQITARVRRDASEVAAEVLQDLTGRGVTIEPPIQALGPDEGYVLDEAAPETLRAYVHGELSEAERSSLFDTLRDAVGDALAGALEYGTIREEDWAETWKEHYDIEKVGRVVVRPAWKDYTPLAGEIVVNLDPGMAFGTGQHPTTRMCIQGLQDVLDAGGPGQGLGRVLDLGSGSGILAIVAIALGADWVLATDTEEQAVQASVENTALNGMQDRITVRPGSIEAVGADGPFDVILANINAAAVSSLAAAMAAEMKPGGWLFAGGVINEREAMARAALEAAGLQIERVMASGDWRTFVALKG